MPQIRSMAYLTSRFQSRMGPVAPLLASVCPSGLNVTENTGVRLPVKGWMSDLGWAGSDTSHSRTVPSKPPLACDCSSALNATAASGYVAAGQGPAE